MKTIAQLARIKRLRAKKRKLVDKFERSPVHDHPYMEVGELYSGAPVVQRTDVQTDLSFYRNR